MAAAVKSLVGFFFVLIVLSANSEMALATGVTCTSQLDINLNLLSGCNPTICYNSCSNYCTVKLSAQVNAATCVLGLIGVGISSCNCCCVTL